MSVPFIRRVTFGILWYVAFATFFGAIGGGIAGARATSHISQEQSFRQGFVAGVPAGTEFRKRYGNYVTVAAIFLAVTGSLTGVLPGTRREKGSAS